MTRKSIYLLIPLLLINLICYSQIRYEKGYYITNDDQRIECLIRNVDWENNPDSFQFKVRDEDDGTKMGIADAKEFGVGNLSKFIRANVKIDPSINQQEFLTTNRNPVWKEETVFLKVLISAETSLYLFKQTDFSQFYYQTGSSEIIPLVQKNYVSSDGKLMTNYDFRQQLWNNLKCENLDLKYISRLKYNTNDLSQYFTKYNSCGGKDVSVFERKKSAAFNIKLTPGLDYSSLKVSNNNTPLLGADLGSKVAFRIGAEFEYILPFNKNKWALLIEPTFQSYNSKKRIGFQDIKIDYKGLEIPMGARHYFFARNNSGIYVNGFIVLSVQRRQFVEYSATGYLHIQPRPNIAAGIGWFHKRATLEVRYNHKRDIYRNYVSNTSNFTKLSVILGYKILSK